MKTDPNSPASILLVDDDKIVLDSLTGGLADLGYRVEGFESAKSALDHYRAQTPDIAVLDYRMAEMNGLDLARQMIAFSYRPMIMLSSSNEVSVVKEAVGLGVSTYLVKPVSAACLAPSIEAALARFAEVNALIRQGSSLSEGMEKNRVISTAVGIVMTRAQLTQDLAFESLRKLARDQRRPLRDVAFDLVDAVSSANAVVQSLVELRRREH